MSHFPNFLKKEIITIKSKKEQREELLDLIKGIPKNLKVEYDNYGSIHIICNQDLLLKGDFVTPFKQLIKDNDNFKNGEFIESEGEEINFHHILALYGDLELFELLIEKMKIPEWGHKLKLFAILGENYEINKILLEKMNQHFNVASLIKKCKEGTEIHKLYVEFISNRQEKLRTKNTSKKDQIVYKNLLNELSPSLVPSQSYHEIDFELFEKIALQKKLSKEQIGEIIKDTSLVDPNISIKCSKSIHKVIREAVSEQELLDIQFSYNNTFYDHYWVYETSSLIIPPVQPIYSCSYKETSLLLLLIKKVEEILKESKKPIFKIPSVIKKKIYLDLLATNWSYSPISSFESTLQFYPLLTENSPRLTSGPCVVSPSVFLENFDSFTQGIFRNFDFSNCIVQGGAIVYSLMGLPNSSSLSHEDRTQLFLDKYPSSDIDIYIYGVSYKKFWEKVREIYEVVNEKGKREVLVLYTSHTINFVLPYPFRRIQIIVGEWSHFSKIIPNTDIDPSGVCFDGRNVYGTNRAYLSFTRKWNIITNEAFAIRGSPKYEERLCKYSKLGFKMVDFFIGSKLEGSYSEVSQGRRLMQELEKTKKEEIMDHFKKENSGIPLSPSLSLDEIRKIVVENGHIEADGYGTMESGYMVLEKVSSGEELVEQLLADGIIQFNIESQRNYIVWNC